MIEKNLSASSSLKKPSRNNTKPLKELFPSQTTPVRRSAPPENRQDFLLVQSLHGLLSGVFGEENRRDRAATGGMNGSLKTRLSSLIFNGDVQNTLQTGAPEQKFPALVRKTTPQLNDNTGFTAWDSYTPFPRLPITSISPSPRQLHLSASTLPLESLLLQVTNLCHSQNGPIETKTEQPVARRFEGPFLFRAGRRACAPKTCLIFHLYQ